MVAQWTEAGELQMPFMIAAGRIRNGEKVVCPDGDSAELRHYFHRFDRAHGTGTLWVWCPSCHRHIHLPRVSPGAVQQNDPFDGLTLVEFAQLELDPQLPLLSRLDQLWRDGVR